MPNSQRHQTPPHQCLVPDKQPQLGQRSELKIRNYYHGYSVDSPAIRVRCLNTKHGILDATARHHQRQQLQLVVQGSIQRLVLAHSRWHHHQGFTPLEACCIAHGQASPSFVAAWFVRDGACRAALGPRHIIFPLTAPCSRVFCLHVANSCASLSGGPVGIS